MALSSRLIRWFAPPSTNDANPTVEQFLVGVTTGGYFWTYEGIGELLTVRSVNDPTTNLDRYDITTSGGSQTRFGGKGNGSGGRVWMLGGDGASPIELYGYTFTGGTIAETAYGAFPSWLTGSLTAGEFRVQDVGYLCDSDDYVLVQSRENGGASGAIRYTVFNTVDMTVAYDHTASGSHADTYLAAYLAADRLVRICTTDANYLELVDISDGTVLDTLFVDMANAEPSVDMIASKTALIAQPWGTFPPLVQNPNTVRVSSWDCTADIFDGLWFTTIPVEWDNTDYGVVAAYHAAAPEYAIVTPTYEPAVSPQEWAMPLVDVFTGEYTNSPTNVLLGYGPDTPGIRGYALGVTANRWIGHNFYGQWSLWALNGPTTLRQRQSPRRSPSRVDYPNLRQRQTPYIR